VAIKLTQELNGQAVGATYNGDAALVPWLIAEGYAVDTSNVRDHAKDTGAPPANDPTLAVNREDPNGYDGDDADHRDFEFGSDSSQLAPRLYSVTPAEAPAAGGDALEFRGDNFTGVTAITLGGTAVTGLQVVGDKFLRCTSAAHAAGAVDVVLTKAAGPDTTVDDGFTYTA
jgi:hypothetical protein